MYKLLFLILSFLLFPSMQLMLGANNRFMHITSKEGLPHQQIEKIMQDDKDKLWIGTRNGLSCYDGYNIVCYFNQRENPRSLSHNFVKALYQDSKKRIWVGTYKGICRYQPATDDFKCYNLPNPKVFSIVETSSGKIICGGSQLFVYDEQADEFVLQPRQDSHFIISMAVDAQDRLFVSTGHSIFYYDSSFSKTTQINPAYFSDFIPGDDGIIPLFFDSKGLLWIGRNGKGVMNIDLSSDKVNIPALSILSDGTVRTIAEDKKGRIWLGTEKGITILNADGTSEILQQDFVDNNKLNDNAVYTILSDKDDNMWIGTYFGGINVLLKNNEQFHWIEAGYTSKHIKGKVIRELVEPQKDVLWIATEDGGLNIYNTITKEIHVFDKIKQLGHNIHELYFDEATNSMWIGTFRNGLFHYNISSGSSVRYLPDSRNGLASDAIFSIKKQCNGTLWVGTSRGLRYYDSEKDVFQPMNHPILDTDFIYYILIDKNDDVWVGTRNNGLYHINTKNNEINGWIVKSGDFQLRDNYITFLYQDSKDIIWIGTSNNGLQFVDPTDLKIRTLNNELSLPKSSICSIIEDEFDRLWVGTSQGLYQFNKERSTLVCYTVEDGLPINQFNFSSAIQAQNGLLYFGSVDGLISFSPRTMKEGRGPFYVHLGYLNINDQTITSKSPDSPLTADLDDMSSITFTYSQSRSFSIEYTAISLGNTSTINYQVRLLGVDKDWRNVGKERKFVGSNLPSGSYKLQIRANNSNEGWDRSPIKEIELIIRPPFYFSIWAFLLYAVIVGLMSYFVYRIFSIRLKEKNAIRTANMEKENLEEINKTKMDFFTSVSHELKTPLSLIMAPLKYITQHQELLPESLERLDMAIKNTNKMVGLIDELITFNKIESGNFQFYIQKGNPLVFIENIAQLFKENAVEKSISLYIHCENNDEEVWFSPSYIEKITNNLLSNAIKFTLSGGRVFINAAITDSSDGYTYLRIEVKDTGIGIVKEELDNIFDKYYQTKRGHNLNSKGWGIGLALVKKFTAVHKGNIAVESEPGKGCCFVVNLNVSESAFHAQDKISTEKMSVPLEQYKYSVPYLERVRTDASLADQDTESKCSILFVEDNVELLKFLSDIFADKYNIYLAENGVEALAIAHKYPIDLVVSDVMMEEMDGNTLCRNLKNDLSTSHIPVILLTAKTDTDDVIKGYESGAEAYVPKPFDPNILELQVKNIIQVKQVQRERIGKTMGSDVESASLSKFDKEFINKLNELIENNIDNNDFSIGDITQNLCLSRSVLHVKMKSLLNISMGDYIRKKRLNKACEYLQEGYNVSETAFKTGFGDPSYFTKSFKKEFGVKPTEYTK